MQMIDAAGVPAWMLSPMAQASYISLRYISAVSRSTLKSLSAWLKRTTWAVECGIGGEAEDCGAGGGRATMWSVRLSCTHPNVAAVVGVNHAGACVDEVLPGEAGAGRDAAIAALRHDHRQVRLDESLAVRGHDAGVRGREVVASGERRAAHACVSPVRAFVRVRVVLERVSRKSTAGMPAVSRREPEHHQDFLELRQI